MTRQVDASCTRQALLEAGRLCFAEHGFHGTSIRMVAERAGRHMSLIAHHFGNKEGLFLAVIQDMLANQPAVFRGPVIGIEELGGDPVRAEALLRDLIIQLFRKMHSTFESKDPARIANCRLWMSAMQMPVPELEPVLRDLVAPMRLQFAACIQAIRPDLPPAEIPFWCALVHGQVVVNTMLRHFNVLAFGPDCYPESAERLAEHVADLTLRAIGRAEGPDGRP